MEITRTRRQFLSNVSRGALAAAVGFGTARSMDLAPSWAESGPESISFGPLESLVCLLQETPVDKLLPALVGQLQAGTDLRRLTAAAALANARTFGGEDYVGFHTLMALSPACHMASELPGELQPLPVFKVLYRNTARIHAVGGRTREVLHPVSPGPLPESPGAGEALRDAVRRKDTTGAERTFAALAASSADDAFNALLYEVQDNAEIHRVALPYRAWDLLDVVGQEHAHTLLRQSLRYCLKAEEGPRNEKWDRPRTLLPKMFDQHRLEGRALGIRAADDAWVDQFSQTIFRSTAEQAADAAAAALAEGIAPEAVGEAISLAANQLLLRDVGRSARDESPGKPMGSVHGDSIGVHACDSANAWRNMAKIANARNTFACLILGAYQAAFDRTDRGGEFLAWPPLPLSSTLGGIRTQDPGELLRDLENAIKEKLQGRASAIVHRYGELGHPARPVFDLFLRFAVSEDGSLHGEKYYRTVSEEFASARPAFRWRQLVALARVTASEYGRPAAGVAEARSLLKV
ncbi:MAG TPA: hypothetical protein VMU54_10335 [Planctomycetota bacterium]|nr:hypothetical protein [Planctomycetota bacterium]